MNQTTRRLDWTNILFLTITPIVALIGEPLHLLANGITWPIIVVFAFYMLATGLSITGGYHRLFSHRAYQTNNAVKLFYLVFGAAACENSALRWSADHRSHHSYTEQGDKDPYNIHKGFFFAHMGWIFYKRSPSLDKVQDLSNDPLIRWQHRYYVPTAIFIGGVVPLGLGYLLGDAWGCFLLAGVTRTVIVHHSTFLINSLCHWTGRRTYSLQTARDSMLVAFLTYGEGYHNFHHSFQYDYRNGIRWYQWDPTKWLIKGMEIVGWAKTLRQASEEQIFKAQVKLEKDLAKTILSQHYSAELRAKMEHRLHETYHALITARARWEQLKVEYRSLKKSVGERREEIAAKLKEEMRMAREHFHSTHEAWSILIQEQLSASPA
ncbi:MAG: fatty acid desaturase [Nitrospirae bacterium]|nr:fatty acid desaturase [Nitrospirota bacterium]